MPGFVGKDSFLDRDRIYYAPLGPSLCLVRLACRQHLEHDQPAPRLQLPWLRKPSSIGA